MIRQEIYVNDTLIDLFQDIAMPLTFNIADIREPEKRDASFSKTLKIPGSKTNNVLFSHIFEINRTTLNTTNVNFNPDFNPNLKADCVVYIDSLEQFRGIIQLLQINTQPDGSFEYECMLLGNVKNIFTEFGDQKLTDLDLSRFDHTWTQAHEEDSWDTEIIENGSGIPFSLGYGYVYPFIDYGLSDDNETYRVTHLFPAIYVKTYIDEIFAAAGFSYASDFFDSTLFKSLIIPFNGDTSLKLTDEQVRERQFFAASTSNATETDTATPLPSASYINTAVQFQNDSTGAYYDPSGIFNTSTGYATVLKSGIYRITFIINCDTVYTGNADTTQIAAYQQWTVGLYKNATLLTSQGDSIGVVENLVSYTKSVSINYTTANVSLSAGDTLHLEVTNSVSALYRYPAPGDTNEYDIFSKGEFINGGSVQHKILAGSTFKLESVRTTLGEGDTMEIARVIPKNILQKDFFNSIVKMFNLYVEVDKQNPTKLLIEPRNDFYTNNTYSDWSEKLAENQVIEVRPCGELSANTFLYTYKADSDYYNKDYTEKTTDIYGEKEYVVVNDFNKNTKKTELIFSPTPLVGYATNDRVAPRLVQKDEQNSTESTIYLKPKETNIRILYYGGLISCDRWKLKDGNILTVDSQFSYPYCGHLDDPQSPTLDLNFDLVSFVYYTANSFTTNNLFNAYHKRFIDEITDKDSKVFTAYFRLDPLDIYKLDFRNYVYINGSYFILNKIEDYDIANYDLTKCELLKIKGHANFVPSATSPPQDGRTFNIVEGGLDEVRNLAASSYYNLVEGGEDEVRDLGATSSVSTINGGQS